MTKLLKNTHQFMTKNCDLVLTGDINDTEYNNVFIYYIFASI